MEKAYLVLDYGTTALKAALFDQAFTLLGCESREFSYSYPAEGWMELDAEIYIQYALDAMEVLLRRFGAQDCLRAISVTGQAETLIPVDGKGLALSPAMVWLDTRAAVIAAKLERQLGSARLYRTTGLPSFDPVLPLAKLPWYRENLPDVWARTCKFLLLRDWVQYRLTGEMRSEPSTNSCTGYFNVASGQWDAELLSLAGIDPAVLPRIAPSGEILPLLPEVAEQLGVPRLPVVNGMLDQAASAIGAGCLEMGSICETTGTCLAVGAPLTCFTPRDPPAMQVLRHGVPDLFLALPYCPTAGMALKWYRDTFLTDWPGGYDDLNRELEARGNVENGLLCLPHFCGYVSPHANPDATAVLYGLSLGHDRVDVGRAVMEGVCFLLRENLEFLEGFGIRSECVVSLGGGANSPFWLQMKADVTNRVIRTVNAKESTSLGCAYGAALAVGDIQSLPKAAAHSEYTPDPARVAYYEVKYHQYLELNRKLGF